MARQTLIRLEMGLPCRSETLHRIRRALRIFTDQILRPPPEDSRFSVHRASDQRWSVSIPKATYQRQMLDEDPIHVNDLQERCRLGTLGLQPFFTAVMDSERPGGRTLQALMELYKPSWIDSHFGEEFIYCLRGPVLITVDGQTSQLEEGDAITFEASLPHQYAPGFEVNDLPALILIVIGREVGKRRLKSGEK